MAARPRARAHTKDDGDQHEEAQLWNRLVPDLKKLAHDGTLHNQLQEKIKSEEARIEAEGYDPTISDYTQLEEMYKRSLELIRKEDESIESLLSRLGILTALREYTEGGSSLDRERERERERERNSESSLGHRDPRERDRDREKDRDGKMRKKRAGGDGDSVSGSQGRSKMARSMSASAPGAELRGGEIVVGGEVAYRQSKQKSSEAEWIQCIVTSTLGDGVKRRYEVRDPIPDETGQHAIYKASINQLIPIPKESIGLVALPPGKHVLARYPDTTAFYRAEVIATKRDGNCRLKFEGEEEVGKETEVERRLVLDVGAK